MHKPAKNPPCELVHTINSGGTSHSSFSRSSEYSSGSFFPSDAERRQSCHFPSQPSKQYDNSAKSSVKLTYDAICGRRLQWLPSVIATSSASEQPAIRPAPCR